MTASLRLVVFDVDGTLVDSQHQICAAMEAAFAAEDAPPPGRDQTLGIVGLSLPEAVEVLAPGLGADRRQRIVAAYKAQFLPLAGGAPAPLYPGAAAVLQELAGRDDLLLGVATGKSRRGLDRMIAAHGFHGLFFTRQVADDHPSKPHPSMLMAALAEAGVAPDRAVMIGDTTFDMEMGRLAGVATIGVGWGYHRPAALAEQGARRVIDRFADLIPAIDSIWGQA